LPVVVVAGRAEVWTATLVGSDVQVVRVTATTTTTGNLSSSGSLLSEAQRREVLVRLRCALGENVPVEGVEITFEGIDSPSPEHSSGFDLPTALAVAMLGRDKLYQRVFALGELSLDGHVRDSRGVFPIAKKLVANQPFDKVILSQPNAREAVDAGLPKSEVGATDTLKSAIDALHGWGGWMSILPHPIEPPQATFDDVVDNEDIRTIRAAVCAGARRLFLVGGPGKTLIARRLGSLLPEMTPEEVDETTAVYSIAGLSRGLVNVRPFRAPHHTVSYVGMFGSKTRPGEVDLAHNGVLFLDEFPEFSRRIVDYFSPWGSQNSRPAMVVAAAEPCPCGAVEGCQCPDALKSRYQERLARLGQAFDSVIHMKGFSRLV